MADEGVNEHKLYEDRLAKVKNLAELKLSAYANGFRPKHTAKQVLEKHEKDDAAALDVSKPGPYSIGGRIVSIRSFGKAAFIVLADRSGTIQVHVKADALGDAYAAFKQMDMGDFVGVEGTAFRSKTGELTLAATSFKPLTKALRPLPGRFAKDEDAKAWAEKQALADVEQRYRQRYVDLLANPEVREVFKKRTKLVQYIRSFLDAREYLEVETPMMHSLVSGAAAKPFTTHHNALDMPLFMRIAPELHLKRLVVGGFDRVYEINRNFRNEGISTRHNPEFTMLEFYEAYATYEDLMDLTEEMLRGAAQHVCGSTTIPYTLGDTTHQLDFGAKWARIPMMEAIRSKVGDLSEKDMSDTDKLRAVATRKAEGPKEAAVIATMNRGELIGLLFEQYVEGTLVQPTFITQFPVEVSPLARRNDADPTITDRFELFCVGREIANAFSELNDPIDQEARFKGQVEAKARGQQETMDYDADYIRALEHGLPPTAGEGIGIDRLAMLLTNSPSIRDVILFPLLKPQK
ncbi:MAG: lysine--tRNA ligase [Archangium sp.]|nr:lysine--tRNA ligase [Archangium sp.]